MFARTSPIYGTICPVDPICVNLLRGSLGDRTSIGLPQDSLVGLQRAPQFAVPNYLLFLVVVLLVSYVGSRFTHAYWPRRLLVGGLFAFCAIKAVTWGYSFYLPLSAPTTAAKLVLAASTAAVAALSCLMVLLGIRTATDRRRRPGT